MVKEEKTRTYVLVTKDWNNGLSEEEILKKYIISKSSLQTYLSKARKQGMQVNKRKRKKRVEKKVPKYVIVASEWNNGVNEEEIIKKYNITKATLHKYLNKASKKGIEIKEQEEKQAKLDPIYIQISRDWNNGLTKEKIIEKYKISESLLFSHLNYAKKRGIELTRRKREKPKKKILQYEIIVQEWNNGLSKERIIEKYNIKEGSFYNYLSRARKSGIKVKENKEEKIKPSKEGEKPEEKKSKKKIPSYILISQDWNDGISEEKILKKYNVNKKTLQTYLSKAKKNGIEIKEKKSKYILVTEDWNNGLSEEEILKKYSICKSTLASYLSKARKKGILVTKREKFEGNKAQENVINESRTNKIQVEEPNHNREEIKELLKTFLPRQVAKRLKISTKTVFDVMDSLNSEERKEVNKAFIRNRPYIFSRVKKLKKDGKSVLEALKSIESNIPLHFLAQLQEVYYNLGLYSYIEKSINKRLYLDETISGKEKEYLKGLKDDMHLEVISRQIRKMRKEDLEKGKVISYDRLSREYNVRTSFLVDLLGREEKDY